LLFAGIFLYFCESCGIAAPDLKQTVVNYKRMRGDVAMGFWDGDCHCKRIFSKKRLAEARGR